MSLLDPVVGKNVSLSLHTPVVFNKIAVHAVSGKCLGILQPGLLLIENVSAAFDPAGADVTNTAKLAKATVGLRIRNISLLVYDGT